MNERSDATLRDRQLCSAGGCELTGAMRAWVWRAASQREWRVSERSPIGNDGDHEVSILIVAVGGLGRCCGVAAARERLDDDHAAAAAGAGAGRAACGSAAWRSIAFDGDRRESLAA